MNRPNSVSEEAWSATEGMPERFMIDIAAGQVWDIRHTVAELIDKAESRAATEIARALMEVEQAQAKAAEEITLLRSALELATGRGCSHCADSIRAAREVLSRPLKDSD